MGSLLLSGCGDSEDTVIQETLDEKPSLTTDQSSIPTYSAATSTTTSSTTTGSTTVPPTVSEPLTSTIPPGSSQIVSFIDENLDRAIRKEVSISESKSIYSTDLLDATEQILHGKRISDVSPLSNITSLGKLHLIANPLSPSSVTKYIPQFEERGVDVVT